MSAPVCAECGVSPCRGPMGDAYCARARREFSQWHRDKAEWAHAVEKAEATRRARKAAAAAAATKAAASSGLLHNMGGPPHSSVEFSGLRALQGASGRVSATSQGMRLDVELPFQLVGVPIPKLQEVVPDLLSLEQLRILDAHEGTFEDRLAHLLDHHAETLPLPGACIVLEAFEQGPPKDPNASKVRSRSVTWWDPVTVMAVFTKSSDSLWLRSKTPLLSRIEARRRLTLFIPKTHVAAVRQATYGRSTS